MSDKQYIKALDIQDDGYQLYLGDTIKIYDKETTITGFSASYNDALEKWETIIHTIGRGDPFERSLDVIEVLEDQPRSFAERNLEVSSRYPTEQDITAIKDEAFKAGYQSATSDMKASAKPYTKTFQTDWKAVEHSYQIGDTGDHDGYTEITNGCISIGLTDNYDDRQVRVIVEALNRWKIDMFELRADGLAIDLYCAQEEKKMLEARIKELESAGGARWVKVSEKEPANFPDDWWMAHWRYADDHCKLDTDLFEVRGGGLCKKGGTGRLEWNQVEWLYESSPSPVQPSWSDNGFPDLSTAPAEVKAETINGLVLLAAKEILRMFYAFGLKTHIECSIINDPTGDTFDFSFRKRGTVQPNKEVIDVLEWLCLNQYRPGFFPDTWEKDNEVYSTDEILSFFQQRNIHK